jgi:hypothetical protein
VRATAAAARSLAHCKHKARTRNELSLVGRQGHRVDRSTTLIHALAARSSHVPQPHLVVRRHDADGWVQHVCALCQRKLSKALQTVMAVIILVQ